MGGPEDGRAAAHVIGRRGSLVRATARGVVGERRIGPRRPARLGIRGQRGGLVEFVDRRLDGRIVGVTGTIPRGQFRSDGVFVVVAIALGGDVRGLRVADRLPRGIAFGLGGKSLEIDRGRPSSPWTKSFFLSVTA